MALSVVSWNVENAARLLADDALREWHARLGAPDVLCLQELRVRAHDTELIDTLRRAIPGWSAAFSLNRDPVNVRFRGGRAYGVGTWVRDGSDAQHAVLPWDREGRVVITTLPGAGVAIVNVYAVNGTSKPYFDHDLGRIAGDRHAFKRRFVRELGAGVAPLGERFGLILIGDWNISQTRQDTFPRLRSEEPHATARREFAEDFFARFDLVDAFRAVHPDAREYTWFNPRARGGRLDAARVDFALLSRALMPRLESATIDPIESVRGISDHVPIRLRLRHAA